MNNDNSSGILLLDSIEQKTNNSSYNITTGDIPNYDFKTVCLKEKVFLKREKSCNIFSPTEVEILFLFKPFGKELGIKPKYMYVKTIQQITNEKHIYTSFDIDYPNIEELSKYEKVKNTISTMVVNFESNFRINISYIFKLELTNSLPIYMENILGLIMKKMFLNLKNFIEMV